MGRYAIQRYALMHFAMNTYHIVLALTIQNAMSRRLISIFNYGGIHNYHPIVKE